MTSKLTFERPVVLPAGDWGRRLHSPWWILYQRIGSSPRRMRPTKFAEAAIQTVITDPQGFPAPMTRAIICDVDGWILFGYATDPEWISIHGHDCWVGSEMGFAIAESTGLVDPLALAVMESRARAVSDRPDWWRE